MSLVEYQFGGDVATLTMNRPEALNALNLAMLADLDTALDRAESEQARCLVVTGAGRAFVAGADLTEMASMGPAEARAFGHRGSSIFRRLETMAIPSVAAVNGFAIGGGCELAMACDIRLAADKASFALPEVGLGVIPGFGGTQRLARLVGLGVAKELLLTGRRVKAARAFEIGLVNAVYPVDELAGAAAELASRIARQSPVGVRAAKTALTLGLSCDMDTALGIELAHFASCFGTEDQREGMGAFVAKRDPAPFTGR
ncbi:MAG: enoyl-CoA hydratase/isomerase family protein [Bifidobacteriaceae bacterium]|jgi:enoyl-CoA hydratase|nr:enoyl-CoA hydratase/isomerase family protein [Bifidobacteriaceae bacterium]